MRILVCGGRAYQNHQRVWGMLDANWGGNGGVLIVGYDPDSPKFQGADQIAFEWALHNNHPVAVFPARWDLYGRSAGPRRNQRQLELMKPTLGIAFPGGTGTSDMVRRMKEAGVRVIEVSQ